MHTRLFLLLAGFGLFTGCGKDEHVGPLIGDDKPDAGDETNTTSNTSVSPATVAPAASSTVNPAVNPVSPGPLTSKLAAACESDTECGAGMTCLKSTGAGLFGGGPAKGFCTVDCEPDPNICPTVQADSTCIQAGDVAYCFPGCQPGGAAATKCQGRTDVACDYTSIPDAPFCRPMCGTDADCGGRKCSIGNGVCVDELLGTGDIGAECDPNIRPSTECLSGFCARGLTEATADTGTCSGLCTLGTDACGVEGQPGNGQAWCLPNQQGAAGDMGTCLQTCGCDDECSHESFRCLTLSADTSSLFGIEGVCSEFDTDTTDFSEGFVLGNMCEPGPDGGGDGGADAVTPDAATDATSDAMSLPVEASIFEDSGDAQMDAD